MPAASKEKVIVRKAKKFGDSTHIILPRSWLGKLIKAVRVKNEALQNL